MPATFSKLLVWKEHTNEAAGQMQALARQGDKGCIQAWESKQGRTCSQESTSESHVCVPVTGRFSFSHMGHDFLRLKGYRGQKWEKPRFPQNSLLISSRHSGQVGTIPRTGQKKLGVWGLVSTEMEPKLRGSLIQWNGVMCLLNWTFFN